MYKKGARFQFAWAFGAILPGLYTPRAKAILL